MVSNFLDTSSANVSHAVLESRLQTRFIHRYDQTAPGQKEATRHLASAVALRIEHLIVTNCRIDQPGIGNLVNKYDLHVMACLALSL